MSDFDGPDPMRPDLVGEAWRDHPMLPCPFAIGEMVRMDATPNAKPLVEYMGRRVYKDRASRQSLRIRTINGNGGSTKLTNMLAHWSWLRKEPHEQS